MEKVFVAVITTVMCTIFTPEEKECKVSVNAGTEKRSSFIELDSGRKDISDSFNKTGGYFIDPEVKKIK